MKETACQEAFLEKAYSRFHHFQVHSTCSAMSPFGGLARIARVLTADADAFSESPAS